MINDQQLSRGSVRRLSTHVDIRSISSVPIVWRTLGIGAAQEVWG